MVGQSASPVQGHLPSPGGVATTGVAADTASSKAGNAKLGLFAAIAILLLCLGVLFTQGTVSASGPLPASQGQSPALVTPTALQK